VASNLDKQAEVCALHGDNAFRPGRFNLEITPRLDLKAA
jgi:hypothetical protein